MMAYLVGSVLLISLNFTWIELVMMTSISLYLFIPLYPLSLECLSQWSFSDELSFFLVYLTLWVIMLLVSSSMSIFKLSTNSMFFLKTVLVLSVTLFLSFISPGIIFFFFFFEFSLIPTLILIMGWGYQVERIQSSLYLLMYTMFASLPLLLGINFIMGLFFIDKFFMLGFYTVGLSSGGFMKILLYWTFMGAFLVKLPMYFFHLWLPKAHVEAPVSGSMILAGVLLKLGGYGVIRFSFILCASPIYSVILMSLSLSSMLYVGMVCCRSNDMKSLVAYSSVSHMALSLSGMITFYFMGVTSALFLLLGHGVSSSALFSYINMTYERSSSRSLYINKGLMNIMVGLSLLVFMISISNMAAPPTINLISEIFLMASVIKFSLLTVPMLLIGSFLVASYTVFFFSFTQQGKLYCNVFSFHGLSLMELLNLSIHIIILNLSFMMVNLIT